MSSSYYSQNSEEGASPFPHPDTPTRPKRAQVKNACVNCQRACKKCDPGRPCQRCVKYNMIDTCVDSTRKPRKKGVKRGPYKKRKKGLLAAQASASPGRASTASARARSSSNQPLMISPVEDSRQSGILGPGAIPILSGSSANRHRSHRGQASPSYTNAREASSSLDSSNAFSPKTPLFEPPGLAPGDGGLHHPIHLSPIRNAAGAKSGASYSSSSDQLRLPPIESFDYAPRSPLTAAVQQQHPASGRVSPQPSAHGAKAPSSPLSMLSDVALISHTKESPSQPLHSITPSSRFESFPSKYIPLSTSRFDYTYRIPPRMRDDESFASSPWDSPVPVALSSQNSNTQGGWNGDNTAGNSFTPEPAQEPTSSTSRGDPQVRRLSRMLSNAHIDQQSSLELDAENTKHMRGEPALNPATNCFQTSDISSGSRTPSQAGATRDPQDANIATGTPRPRLGKEPPSWMVSSSSQAPRTSQHRRSLSAYKL